MIGLGMAALGRPQYINIKEKNTPELHLNDFKQLGLSVLENAYQLGIRYFDTAPGYGLAEHLLLDWLQTKNDASIEIATKWGYTYVANFNPNATIHEKKEHSLSKLNEQWQVSKGFLPYLKVYQIHSTTFDTGILENQAVLEQLAFLKQQHQIKIGITTTGNNQVEVIKKALDVSVHNAQLFDTFQVTYNVLDQSLSSIYKDLVSLNKNIIIKEALANGRLFRNKNYTHYTSTYNILEQLAKKYSVGIDAIALNFCEQTIVNATVLSGASQISHLKDNLKVATFNLTNEEVQTLKSFSVPVNNYWQERKSLHWN